MTSEGEYHRHQRLLIEPAFHRRQIAAHEAVIVEHGVRLREQWRDNQQIGIVREMKSLTLGIISKALFDTKTDAEADEITEAVEY